MKLALLLITASVIVAGCLAPERFGGEERHNETNPANTTQQMLQYEWFWCNATSECQQQYGFDYKCSAIPIGISACERIVPDLEEGLACPYNLNCLADEACINGRCYKIEGIKLNNTSGGDNPNTGNGSDGGTRGNESGGTAHACSYEGAWTWSDPAGDSGTATLFDFKKSEGSVCIPDAERCIDGTLHYNSTYGEEENVLSLQDAILDTHRFRMFTNSFLRSGSYDYGIPPDVLSRLGVMDYVEFNGTFSGNCSRLTLYPDEAYGWDGKMYYFRSADPNALNPPTIILTKTTSD